MNTAQPVPCGGGGVGLQETGNMTAPKVVKHPNKVVSSVSCCNSTDKGALSSLKVREGIPEEVIPGYEGAEVGKWKRMDGQGCLGGSVD